VALCHEGLGKVASAWSEFLEVESLSRRDGRNDRADVAKQHAEALKPRLSYLTLTVSDAARAQGLEIKRGGGVVGVGALGVAVPIDPGEHVIEATGSGLEPWSTTVTISGDAQREAVEVPALQPLPEKETDTTPVEALPESDSGLTSLQVGGLITGGAGVVALGIGGVFGLRAISKNGESEDSCDGNLCPQQGYDARKDALSAGNVATAAGIAGAVLVAAGATLWLVGAPSSKPTEDTGPAASKNRNRERGPSLAALPAVLPAGAGVALLGRF
jgi:hypothetical protein